MRRANCCNWLTSKDYQGDRRLDNPEDFVRMEIGTALSRNIRVIPVLVGDDYESDQWQFSATPPSAVHELRVLPQLWCNPECFLSGDFHFGVHVVTERWPGRPPRAQHTARIIFAGSLGRSCHGAHVASSPRKANTGPSCSLNNHYNALDRKALRKTSVLVVTQAQTLHQVPQVHQSCVRTDLSTVRHKRLNREFSEDQPTLTFSFWDNNCTSQG
jgi:hypothetical protein